MTDSWMLTTLPSLNFIAGYPAHHLQRSANGFRPSLKSLKRLVDRRAVSCGLLKLGVLVFSHLLRKASVTLLSNLVRDISIVS